ncbi:MAG: hypothetical protein JSR80_08565, partial [Verrucomicrobia bacterium]|nr:hypothetical protein [Verrucomicrobiota bacterium]
VHGLKDFSLYRFDDPILQFFREKSISSRSKIRYALETKAGACTFEVGDKPLSKEELS